MFKNTKPRVNVKARLDRHLRIIKESIGGDKTHVVREKPNSNFNLFLFIILLITPFYPSLASFMYDSSSYDFYRGDIDESSIIESYYTGDDTVGESYGPMLESNDSYLSVNTILDDNRDVAGTNEILKYEVKPGDSLYTISYNFKVSTNSIYWANDFDKNHVIHPGDIIKVPPVSGLIHQVKSGDTLSTIAKKYEIDEAKIRAQNGLDDGGGLIAGEVIVIPGAVKKDPPKPVVPKNNTKALAKNTNTKTKTGYPKTGNSKIVAKSGTFNLKRREPKWSFYWGNCTWYVAQYKNVTWGGNANQWLKNARAKGVATGDNPSVGAIVQFNGRGYNPRYGHVGIVVGIEGENILISDMNYRRLNEVTYRKVSIYDRAIQGYIYAE